ncbi:DUF6427 family protein [Chryseobacterium sp. MFBS3-17]|uniref:DUF6427 family protein n=1 Tax=Chryseobacterium sp. MFBS3-17 TaxID=2886689 RepID=UPI001D0EDF72|nr:DUF6427 family protein [Chryseobacterium sp. MFBS3-17]MCC2590792.1 DUF6427 family protein [Chryseobacterium sp. MFBS3-17]
MFRLLSKESNIFSTLVYPGLLLLVVAAFNIFNFSNLYSISTLITFAGITLGFFCFNTIGLTYHTHLPLFLYTFFVISFYPGSLDIGLAVALLTNSFLILLLTSTNDEFRKKSYLLVGSILAITYIFLPVTWPMTLFVILQIFATSNRIGLHLFRLFFGIMLIAISYFSLMYFLNYQSWDDAYFPFYGFSFHLDFTALVFLSPVVLMLLYALWDHFRHYNKKSPVSKFKYTFLLLFLIAQLITVILYMGSSYEYLLLLALPVSIMLSRVLRFADRYWKQELGLWIIIGSLAAFKIATTLN